MSFPPTHVPTLQLRLLQLPLNDAPFFSAVTICAAVPPVHVTPTLSFDPLIVIDEALPGICWRNVIQSEQCCIGGIVDWVNAFE